MFADLDVGITLLFELIKKQIIFCIQKVSNLFKDRHRVNLLLRVLT